MESSTQKTQTAPKTKAAANKKSTNQSQINQHDEEAVQAIIKKYSAIAAAAALVPVPTLDLAALAGIQIKMVHSISKQHNVGKLSDSALKLAISSMATTLPSGSIATAGSSLLKIIPGIGTAISMVASPGYYAASTYAVGKVFHSHFASGETLLNFDPAEAKEAYKLHFEEKAD